MLKDGKPWLPVMGEIHFSRVYEESWDKTLELMKAGGLSIASTYVFWNHHEEIKGHFNFEGRFNLRKFARLCDKNGLMIFVRIGPWVHGEGRNGGFPDWLLEECYEACKDMDTDWDYPGVGTRKIVEPYMTYVRRYLNAVLEQIKDLKNIAGIQLDNELPDNPEYLTELRNIVEESGIDAPLYTATGWRNAKVGKKIIPSFGGYAERAWVHDMEDICDAPTYFFKDKPDANADIGTDMFGENKNQEVQYDSSYPYITCELGAGVGAAYHRRPKTYPEDISSLALCALGSGVNLLGFFMYRGGYNPLGVNTTMQESVESGYESDYPVISYDFLAPIGEGGQIRKHYYLLKTFAEFCNCFGERLALMSPVLPIEMPLDDTDKETIRCAVRTDGKSGFLFVNNHNHIKQLSGKTDVDFNIKLIDETISIHIDEIASGVQFHMPFNFDYEGLSSRYISAQLYRCEHQKLYFYEIEGIKPILCRHNGEKVELCDCQVIDGIEIILLKPEDYSVSVGEKLNVCRLEENKETFEYFKHLKLVDDSAEFKVVCPKNAEYLRIDWDGNVAAAFCNHKLICDQFYNGEPWIIDASNLNGEEIIFKILPMNEKERQKIYINSEPKFGIVEPVVKAVYDEIIHV